jgi:SspJ family small acid-soluble spore protein
VPALRPAVEIDTESVEGAVPDAGDTLNQDALAVAVQASVPLPLFEI